jgi:hypothetical protein
MRPQLQRGTIYGWAWVGSMQQLFYSKGHWKIECNVTYRHSFTKTKVKYRLELKSL